MVVIVGHGGIANYALYLATLHITLTYNLKLMEYLIEKHIDENCSSYTIF